MTYDELVEGGEVAVAGLIGRQETLQLEFKANAHQDPIFVQGTLTKAGKKLLAKEASAFANSAGGVIVFGVDCRVVEKVDQADKLTPITSLSRAETSVRDAAADLLQPRHDGIRVTSVRTAANADAGFIVVDIPRSDRRPHRSEATDQKQYFKRSGSSSFPMEHYDIEDAFRRVSSPELKLEVSYDLAMRSGYEYHYNMNLAIANMGELTAKMVSVQLWDLHGANFVRESASGSAIKVTTYDRKIHLAGSSDFAVHPGETRVFYRHKFKTLLTADGGVETEVRALEPKSLGFNYSLSSENMRMIKDAYYLPAQEMEQFSEAYAAAERRKTGKKPIF